MTLLALGTICNLCIDLDNQIYFGRCGTCQIIITCIKRHLRNVDIVYKCIACISKLSYFEDNQNTFGQNGGCELILKLIPIHPGIVDAIDETRRQLSYKNLDNRIKLRVLKIGDEKFDKVYVLTFEGQKHEVRLLTQTLLFYVLTK